MWRYLVRIILRNRLANLIVLALITAFMGYKALDVQLSYEMRSVLPPDDTTSIVYQKFKQTFGEDGSVLFIGIRDPEIFTLEHYTAWYDLTERLLAVDGVDEVVSITRFFDLERNDSLGKFQVKPVVSRKPVTQAEVDTIRERLLALPFYEDIVLERDSMSVLMAVTLDKDKLNTQERIPLVHRIHDEADLDLQQTGVVVH